MYKTKCTKPNNSIDLMLSGDDAEKYCFIYFLHEYIVKYKNIKDFKIIINIQQYHFNAVYLYNW